MSETVVLNGVNYTIPDPGDQPNWGTGLTPYLVAVAATIGSTPPFMQVVSAAASPTTMISGKTYLVTTSSIAITLNLPAPATNMWMFVKDASGAAATHNITIHRPGAQTIDGTAADKVLSRNFGTWIICSDGTNYFVLNEFPDSGLVAADYAAGSISNVAINAAAAIAFSKLASLTSAHLLIGSAGNVPTDTALSGDVAITNAGVSSVNNVQAGVITNAMVNASAAIAFSKLASLTSAHLLIGSAGNVATDVAVSGDVALANTGAFTLVNASVTGQVLTSLSATLGTITAADSILIALGKIINARIVQVVLGTSTTSFSTTSNSYQTTNLTAPITPKASGNKVLVLACTTIQIDVSNKQAFVTIARGGSNILAANGFAACFAGTFTTQMVMPVSVAYLDSPAATTAQTYALQIKNADGASAIEMSGNTSTQIMILIEIGA